MLLTVLCKYLEDANCGLTQSLSSPRQTTLGVRRRDEMALEPGTAMGECGNAVGRGQNCEDFREHECGTVNITMRPEYEVIAAASRALSVTM